jgi:hypothetical protein
MMRLGPRAGGQERGGAEEAEQGAFTVVKIFRYHTGINLTVFIWNVSGIGKWYDKWELS